MDANLVFHVHNKRIKVDYHPVWELVKHDDLVVPYISTLLKLEDIFTNLFRNSMFIFEI